MQDSEQPGGQNTSVSADLDSADLVRHLAHELRQPLSTMESIAYYLDLVLPEEAPAARQQLEKLQQLVTQSSWIVSDAVDFVQASRPAPRPLSAADLLERARALCGDTAPEFVTAPGAPLPDLLIDPGQGENLFRNLVSFFRKVGKGAAVEVQAVESDGRARIRFSATAAGFTQTQLDALFAPAGTPPGEGSSLGVASMRRIAEAHGGFIHTHLEDGRVALELSLPI